MALPLIPIILAVASVASGVVQGISNAKNAKSQAKAVQEQTQEQVDARARAAKKLMQEQKTSFLKSGVYFDSGTPVDVINETYDTSIDDVNAMAKDGNTQISNLMRQGKTAFFTSIMDGIANGAAGFLGAGGMSSKSSIPSNNNFRTFYQNLTGKYTGGFGTLPNSDITKIV